MRAVLKAHAAADAEAPVDERLARRVHFHLARAGTAAHAEVFDRAADSGALVRLEVGEADDDVRVHHRAADLRLLHIFPVDRDDLLVGALEPVPDQNLAAGRKGGVAVFIGRLDVVERVLAPPDI